MLEAVHVKHPQIAMPALRDLLGRNAAQIADVADVFRDGEIGIEAEGLRQIAGLRTRFARRVAEDFRRAGGRLHHAGQDLKRGRLARAVGADQAEDLAVFDFEIDAAHGFHGRRSASRDRERGRQCVWTRRRQRSETPEMESAIVICLNRPAGHVSPWTRISPSAGMPGLANPNAALELQLDAHHLLHAVVAEVGVLGRERGLRIDARAP